MALPYAIAASMSVTGKNSGLAEPFGFGGRAGTSCRPHSQASGSACNPGRGSFLEMLELLRSRAPAPGTGFENQPGVDGLVGLRLPKVSVGPFMARRGSVEGVGHQRGPLSRDSDYARPRAWLAAAAFSRWFHPLSSTGEAAGFGRGRRGVRLLCGVRLGFAYFLVRPSLTLGHSDRRLRRSRFGSSPQPLRRLTLKRLPHSNERCRLRR